MTGDGPHSGTDSFRYYATAAEAESSEGRSLLDDPDGNPICAVGVDASVPCVTVVWKRYATSLQLRLINERILVLAAQHGLSKVISDDTALPTIHPDDQAWIVNNWMPRAVAAGLRSVAAKSPMSYFGKASVDRIRMAAQPPLTIRHFTNLGAARAWLATQ